MNEVVLAGTITHPKLDHTINSERIYSAILSTVRTSGAVDAIPILLPEYLLPDTNRVWIMGEFRSHNTPDKHLKLYVYVTDIMPVDDYDQNQIVLEGYVCKSPVCRRTPKGRIITDLLIAVPRRNMSDRSDYIPVVVWEDKSNLLISTKVLVEGRIQSRNHRKGIAYEISCNRLTV